MIVDRINLNQIRVFHVVYETRSQTIAARKLSLTQSGVSQHLKALEDQVAERLFDRVKQRLIPTAMADLLYERSHRGLSEIEHGLHAIMSKKVGLEGLVRLGLPPEFGHDIVMPLLGRFQRKHPGVQLKIEIGLAPRMNDLVLSGAIDFAFVDEFISDRRIDSERVYNEDLELCVAEALLPKKLPAVPGKEFFETLPYVEYKEGEQLLRQWFLHHLGARQLKLGIRAYAEDAYCIAQLVVAGVGAGVLPGALLERLRAQGNKISSFSGSGKALKSGISLAYIRDRNFGKAQAQLLQYLRDEIRKLS